MSLQVLAPPISMAGDYALTFVADSSCTMLPQEARADVHGDDSGDGECESGQRVLKRRGRRRELLRSWNGLGFGVAGDYVAFWLETLVEQPAPNTFLALAGWPRRPSPRRVPHHLAILRLH